jgi:putative nucleotidyltransferase with HDIG domain
VNPGEATESSTDMSRGSVKRVLVVDDEAGVEKVLCQTLRFEGYVCDGCHDGFAALKLISSEGFDAIISDFRMPGMNGLELLRSVRKTSPHLAFIMVTAVDDLGLGIQAMKEGAADYLLKPLNLEAVTVALHRALEQKRLEIEVENYRENLETMVNKRTSQLHAALERIELTYDETLEALAAALDLRDNETAGHSRRVMAYCIEIARPMDCDNEQIKNIARGALLHDIGKIGIPDAILLKPGRLTDVERSVMATHVRIGYEILNRISFLAGAADIVLTHHEQFDGAGYPQGLKGAEIPLGARIFAVADTLDAMTSDRPYRRAQSWEVARKEILRVCGSQFDPAVVSVFLSIDETTWRAIRQTAEMGAAVSIVKPVSTKTAFTNEAPNPVATIAPRRPTAPPTGC